MPTRKLLSMDDLIRCMTSELQRIEGCEECKVMGVYRLAEPDLEGGNWTLSGVKVSGVPVEIYQPAIERIVSTARIRFNLE